MLKKRFSYTISSSSEIKTIPCIPFSKLLKEFKAKYPGCEKSDSRFSDKYDKLIIEEKNYLP